jgi:cation transport ATPase
MASKPLDEFNMVEQISPQVTEHRIELLIKGMTCASCVLRVEKALEKVPGVAQAHVNLATHRASLSFISSVQEPQSLINDLLVASEKAGYEASLIDGAQAAEQGLAAEQEQEVHALNRALTLALILTLPVFTLEMHTTQLVATSAAHHPDSGGAWTQLFYQRFSRVVAAWTRHELSGCLGSLKRLALLDGDHV